MPSFIYTGSSGRLVIAGKTLVRGIPAELEGRAADAASRHPRVSRAGKAATAAAAAPAPTDARAALEAMSRDELRELARGAELSAVGNKADLVERLVTAAETSDDTDDEENS